MELRLRNVRRAGLLLLAAGAATMIWGLVAEGASTSAGPWAAAYAGIGILLLAAVRYIVPAAPEGTDMRLAASGTAVALCGLVVGTIGWVSDTDTLVAYGLAGVAAGVTTGLIGLRRSRG